MAVIYKDVHDALTLLILAASVAAALGCGGRPSNGVETGVPIPQTHQQDVVPSATDGIRTDTPQTRQHGDLPPTTERFRLGTPHLKYDGYLSDFDISRDGRFVVTVDREVDRWNERITTRVRRVATGEEILAWTGEPTFAPPDVPSKAAFSPDGTMLARPTGLWDIETRQRICALEELDKGSHQDITFSRDGTTLAILINRRISVWDVNQRHRTCEMMTDSQLTSVSLSPDGRFLALVLPGDVLTTYPQIWDTRTGKPVREFKMRGQIPARGYPARVTMLRFSPDGRRLIGTDETQFPHSDYRVHFWDVEREMEQDPLDTTFSNGGTSSNRDAAISPSGRLLATVTSFDGSIRIWNLEDASLMRTLAARAWYVRFTGDGRTLVTAGRHSVRFWDVATGQEQRKLSGHHDKINALAFAPDGRTLASGSDDATIRTWDVKTGKPVHVLQGLGALQGSVDFSPDGKWLLAAGHHESSGVGVRVWNTASGELQLEVKTGARKAWFLSNSSFASWSQPTLTYWDLTGVKKSETTQVAAYPSRRGPVVSLDRERLATNHTHTKTSVVEVATGRQIREIASDYTVMAKALSRNGELLALGTGYVEGTDIPRDREVAIRVMRVSDGRQLRKFVSCKRSLTCLCFSPNGKVLAGGAYDRTLRLWNLETGRMHLQPPSPPRLIYSLAFSPDGRLLASGDARGTIVISELTIQPAPDP